MFSSPRNTEGRTEKPERRKQKAKENRTQKHITKRKHGTQKAETTRTAEHIRNKLKPLTSKYAVWGLRSGHSTY